MDNVKLFLLTYYKTPHNLSYSANSYEKYGLYCSMRACNPQKPYRFKNTAFMWPLKSNCNMINVIKSLFCSHLQNIAIIT